MWKALLVAAAVLVTVGCGASNAGRTLVYAVEGTTDGAVDPSLCSPGVGAEIDLMIREGIAFAIDVTGTTAFLATCDITDGAVGACGLLPPFTALDLQGDRISGSSTGRVELADSACEGADIQVSWDMVLDGERVLVDATAVWQLDRSAACDALEGDIRANDPQGRGVDGCIVQYAFEAEQVATCAYVIDDSGALVSNRDEPCRY